MNFLEDNPGAECEVIDLRPNTSVLVFRGLQTVFFLGLAMSALSIGLPHTLNGSGAAVLVLILGLGILLMSLDMLFSMVVWPYALKLDTRTSAFSTKGLALSHSSPEDRLVGYSTATFHTQGRNNPSGFVLYSAKGSHVVVAPCNIRNVDTLRSTLTRMHLMDHGKEGRVRAFFKRRYRFDSK